jgi:hypothetical protein
MCVLFDMTMSILSPKLFIYLFLMFQIWKIKMEENMIFVLDLGLFFFFSFFCLHMDSLTLSNMTLILCIDMNSNVSIETHVIYDKLFILIDSRQNQDRVTYLKSG